MRIDHLVWYTSDLAAGRTYFATRMDCEPLYGGEHPGEGTANAVMALGAETYLEILGRDVNQPAASLDPEVRGLEGARLYHWRWVVLISQHLLNVRRRPDFPAGRSFPAAA